MCAIRIPPASTEIVITLRAAREKVNRSAPKRSPSGRQVVASLRLFTGSDVVGFDRSGPVHQRVVPSGLAFKIMVFLASSPYVIIAYSYKIDSK